MPNQLRLDRRAAEFYRSLDRLRRNFLDSALDYIRDNPEPDGERIVSVSMDPVVIYVYNDGEVKVSYGLSYFPKERMYQITVFAIDLV